MLVEMCNTNIQEWPDLHELTTDKKFWRRMASQVLQATPKGIL